MRPTARDAFPAFTARLEGRVPFMYLDVRGLVTTGVGNLLEPSGAALALPWHHLDGSPATPIQIADAWIAVKSRHDLQMRGGMAFRNVSSLRLSDEAIDDLVRRKLDEDEAALRARYPEWEAWPADAQLGVLSMAWAMGPRFGEGFPLFDIAVRAECWEHAADECRMDDRHNPGVSPRNVADRILFRNASRVMRDGLDPSALYYPMELWPEDPPQAA